MSFIKRYRITGLVVVVLSAIAGVWFAQIVDRYAAIDYNVASNALLFKLAGVGIIGCLVGSVVTALERRL